jgi:four helix bundle protein
MQLVPAVYRLVKHLPAEERYALSDQRRRAVVSIPANIAEGQARQHAPEFAQHLAIARGGLAEVDTLLLVAVSERP